MSTTELEVLPSQKAHGLLSGESFKAAAKFFVRMNFVLADLLQMRLKLDPY